MSTGHQTNDAARHDSPAAPGSTPAAAAAVQPKAGSKPGQPLPPYRVVLHNDDLNEMRYVVRTIIELTRLDSGRAMEIMMTAHTRGAAQVLITHKERAELFRDQFASKRLRVSIEPVN